MKPKRVMSIALLATMGTLLFSCQNAKAAPPQRDLTVDAISYDPGAQLVSIVVKNTGKNIVTAFGVRIEAIVDGKIVSNFQEIEELLPLILSRRMISHSPVSWDGAVLPGGEYTDRVSYSIPFGQSASFTAEVIGITYSSGDSWASDPQAIATINGLRASTARSQAALIQALDTAQTAGSPEEDLTSIRANFIRLRSRARGSVGTGSEMSEATVSWALAQLDNIERSGDISGGLASLRELLQFHHDQTLSFVKVQ